MKSFRILVAFVCTVALSLAFAGLAAAWEHGHGGPPDIDTQVQRMTELLDLDAQQQQSLRSVLEEQRAKLDALREQAKTEGRSEDLRSAFRDTARETRERIEALLTPDQLQKFQSLHGSHGPAGWGPPDIDTQVQRLTDDLGLDAKQQESLRNVLEEQRAKFDALHEQAKSKGRSPELSDAFRNTARETRQRIEALLTPDQIEKFESLQADRGPHHGDDKGSCNDAGAEEQTS